MMIRIRSFVGLAALVAAMVSPAVRAGEITILNVANSKGYQFTNFDGPNTGTPVAGTGTNMNGIANNGTVVGFTTNDNVAFSNFTANPLTSTTATSLNIGGSTAAMAFGVNSAGTVVGTDGNGNAFSLAGGTLNTFIPNGGTSALAFGINDHGVIVGQYTAAGGASTPGFIQAGNTVTTVNAPSGTSVDVVNAQGINNHGELVGFYVGNDGNQHGFIANAGSASNGSLSGTAVADPTIPPISGEPGATFVFSQILGINDSGLAVGYYQDSTGSQHGYLYNANTGQYSFLDDPNAAFNNGVEITQITGINDSGEITGFYSDANGVFHGFVASVPEPSSVALLGIGLTTLMSMGYVRRQRQARAAA